MARAVCSDCLLRQPERVRPVVVRFRHPAVEAPMTKLSMHEQLPFDEDGTASSISTGDLPQAEEVRVVVTEAYERYRSNGDGEVAAYIPALAEASPDWFGISVVGARGNSYEIGDVETTFS